MHTLLHHRYGPGRLETSSRPGKCHTVEEDGPAADDAIEQEPGQSIEPSGLWWDCLVQTEPSSTLRGSHEYRH